MEVKKGRRYVSYLLLLVMVGIVMFTLVKNIMWWNKSVVILSTITILLLIAPRTVLGKIRLNLPPEVLSFIEVFIFLGMYLGEIKDAFFFFPHWDTLLHFLSGVLIALMGFLLIYPLYMQKPARAYAYLILLFTVSFAIAAGGIWELIEYGIDVVFQPVPPMQRSGLPDTMGDLAIESFSALLTGIAAYLFVLKKGHAKFIERIARDFMEHNRYLFEVEVEEKKGN